MADVRLTVGGVAYTGWTEIRVTRTIEAIAGSFELAVKNRERVDVPIRREQACAIEVGTDTLITGYVDAVRRSYAKDERTFTVTGRDKAGALVDNSAELGAWEFTNLPVLDLAVKLAKPFGIVVALQPGINDPAVSTSTSPKASKARRGGSPTGVGSAGKSSSTRIGKPNTKFTINEGESPFAVLDRACRIVGLLPVSDGLGGIVLTRAGGLRATDSLIKGANILAAEFSDDAQRRYRTYIVRGQSVSTDDLFGDPAVDVKGVAQDVNVARAERVLTVMAEGAVTPAFAKQRAAWEATTRAARAIEVTYTVQGWTQSDGNLWPINALVAVRDDELELNGDMLITSATYTVSNEDGTITKLKLVAPDAFIPEPVIVKPANDNAFAGLLG